MFKALWDHLHRKINKSQQTSKEELPMPFKKYVNKARKVVLADGDFEACQFLPYVLYFHLCLSCFSELLYVLF